MLNAIIDGSHVSAIADRRSVRESVAFAIREEESAISNVDDIKAAIQALPEREFVLLRQWFGEKDWERWDRQLEADAKAGRLDFLIQEARDEKAGGTLRNLYMHRATRRFWNYFEELPAEVQKLAQQNFEPLKLNPRYPSLHFN